MNHQFKNKMI